MIKFLHDFENSYVNLKKLESEFKGYDHMRQSLVAPTPPNLNIDDLVHDTFFPQITMSFSQKENPLQIVKSMEKQYAILREKMLLFQQ